MATQFSVNDGVKWKPRFFSIFIGQALSLLGSQLVGFALIWYLTETTGSAIVLTITTLVVTVPRVVLSPFIGPLVDRWDRRKTMIIADLFIAVATIVLAVLFSKGNIELWHIYLILFLRSSAGAFHGTSMSASTSLMVPKEHLTRVQGVNQMLNGGLSIVAAPLGALMLGLLEMQWILTIDVITATLAIVPLFFFAIPQPDMKVSDEMAGERPSYWDDLKAGVKYVYSWKGLLVILGMATLLNMVLTPAFSFLPLLISEHFGLGAMELGLLDSTFGIGIIVGGALLGIWGGFKRKIYTTMVGLMGIGIGTLGLGLLGEDGFYIAIVFAVIMGVSQPITNGSLMGVMQAKVSPDMQGRVFSLTGSVSGGLAPLGLIIAGPLSEAYGIQIWFVVGGIICLLMSISGFVIPTVRNFEDYEAPTSGEMLEVPAE
jgi:DHA3 family macrolide efflux protein-like MFS transporter